MCKKIKLMGLQHLVITRSALEMEWQIGHNLFLNGAVLLSLPMKSMMVAMES